MQSLYQVFIESFQNVIETILIFLPKVLVAIVIVVLGWVLAKLVQRLLERFLKIIRLDRLADKVEINKILKKGGIKLTFSQILSGMVYVVLLLIVFVSALNIVGLTGVASLLDKIVLYVPNVIAGIFILILGGFIASVVEGIVRTALANAEIKKADILSSIAKTVVFAFAIIIALQQLNIRTEMLGLALNIILASFGLGLGIAIGLGSKDIVKEFLEKKVSKKKK